jgi:hypothetical protein
MQAVKLLYSVCFFYLFFFSGLLRLWHVQWTAQTMACSVDCSDYGLLSGLLNLWPVPASYLSQQSLLLFSPIGYILSTGNLIRRSYCKTARAK